MPIAFKPSALLVCICLTLIVARSATAQDIVRERVVFSKGSKGTVVKNRIKGAETIDYLVNARSGQRMLVVLETSNTSNYFNILAPGTLAASDAMYISAINGNRFEAELPSTGDYTIRVFLMRNAARRNEKANYSLAVNIFDGGSSIPAPAHDFADGFGGGPDFWQVFAEKTTGPLKLMESPSAKSKVVIQMAIGEVLQNQGCKMTDSERWCKVSQVGGKHLSGWALGRFLREAPGPNADATLSSPQVHGNGQPFHATGEIPCSVSLGQPTRNCAFGVIRNGGGNADVWINIEGHSERHIIFKLGKPVSSDTKARLTFEKSADLYLIRIGDERYEIPEAVIFGG